MLRHVSSVRTPSPMESKCYTMALKPRPCSESRREATPPTWGRITQTASLENGLFHASAKGLRTSLLGCPPGGLKQHRCCSTTAHTIFFHPTSFNNFNRLLTCLRLYQSTTYPELKPTGAPSPETTPHKGHGCSVSPS